jgi:glycerol kinase
VATIGAPEMSLLIGIDEGTTAVKAVLYDRELHPLREARRRKASTHPQAGWVEQDADEVLAAVVDAVAELLADAPGEIAGCGLDHQGESVLAWDAETGRALSPIVVWQDKRSAAVLDAIEASGDGDEVRRRSGLPLDPYFSAGKLTWLLEHVPAVAAARDAGTLRLGNVDAWLTDKLGGVFATDESTASRTQLYALGDAVASAVLGEAAARDAPGQTPADDGPGRAAANDAPGAADIPSSRAAGAAWDTWLCEQFGVPAETLPPIRDSAGALATLRHPSWPIELPLTARVVDQQAALAGAGCVLPGRVKATYGTGVFVLAHAGDAPPAPAGGLLPTVAWRIDGRTEYALDGGVFAAGEMLEWLCRELGLAEEPAALGALARGADSSDGVKILPGITGVGAPWWRPDARGAIAGLTAGTKRAQVARAALEGIAWRVADVVAAIRDTVPVHTLRVDGGLTNEPALLQLQADAIGVPVERGAADATALGAAALAAVGAGLLSSTADIAALVPTAEHVEPQRDGTWREAEHEAWRRFVRQAIDL